MENKPLYAIIPANVFYDHSLSANARLLFGEISGLTNSEGFCWAGNQYFQKRHNVTKRSISKWISELQDAGYINVQCFLDENQQQRRHIYLVDKAAPLEENFMGGRTNLHGGHEENFHTPTNKSSTLIVKDNNKTNTKEKRGAVRPTHEEVQEYCNSRGNGIDGQYFVDYYSVRGWKTKGGNAVKDWQACVRTWEKGDRDRASKGKGTDSIRGKSLEQSLTDRSWAE